MTVHEPIDIVFVLYPRFALLDFAGPLEVFDGLPNKTIRFASAAGGDLQASPLVMMRGIERLADVGRCDLVCIPGGLDQSSLDTPEMHGHLRRLASAARYVTSVCNGSLVWARAGVLEGRRTACHWAFLHQLAQYGAIADPARTVRDGRFFSGGGVTAGIDFALLMAAEIAGDVYAQSIQLNIEYAPDPPFASGHPDTAPTEVLRAFNANFGPSFEAAGGRLAIV